MQAGYQVTLIAQHHASETVQGVNIIALPVPKSRLQRISRLTWLAFRLGCREKAALYHLHDPELLPAGLLLKLSTGKKLIYDIHENVGEQILNKEWIAWPFRRILSFLYRLIERISIPFFDYLIIAEDSYRENYKGIKKIVPVRNYPVFSYINEAMDEQKNVIRGHSKNSNPAIKRLVYVGGISRLRGVMEMLQAVSILHQQGYASVRLELVGPIQGEGLEKEIKACIQKNGLDRFVRLPGRLPFEQVYEIIKDAYLGLAILHPNPNYVQSLPTKMFEYMSVGLPVIVSDFSLWREIISGSDCGATVNPLDPSELARTIKYFLDEPELARAKGDNGRRAVIEKYSWDREKERLLSIYRLLLS